MISKTTFADIGYLFLIPTICLITTAPFAYGYGSHSSSYNHGYQAGLNNVTLTTGCNMYTVKAYDNCSSGFNDAGNAVQKTTPEYRYGFQIGKNDSLTECPTLLMLVLITKEMQIRIVQVVTRQEVIINCCLQ